MFRLFGSSSLPKTEPVFVWYKCSGLLFPINTPFIKIIAIFCLWCLPTETMKFLNAKALVFLQIVHTCTANVWFTKSLQTQIICLCVSLEIILMHFTCITIQSQAVHGYLKVYEVPLWKNSEYYAKWFSVTRNEWIDECNLEIKKKNL